MNQSRTPAPVDPIPKLRTLLWRGCRRKCPHCGRGALFQRWIKLYDRCPVCRLQYLSNQGDLWGPLVFLDRLLFIIPLIVLLYFRIWNPNWFFFFLVGGTAILVLVLTVPQRLGMSLAVDYLIRRKSGDLPDQNPPDQS
jgi:uncharacterized protein (DUF983 family)